ncbi:MAG TPA: hypothetical protein VGE07_08245 [Herpetosiphonaceae bacterium]
MPIRFSPDGRNYYWAAGACEPSETPMITFGFGREGAELVHALLRNTEEPNDFHVFRATWEPAGCDGDLAGLWAGFMALRYCLGYFSQWELISADLRAQAERLDSPHGAGRGSLARQIQQWHSGWERQLDPLMADLRNAAGPRYAY